MAAPINFESANLKDEEKRLRRQQKKAAQAQYLEKVKQDHEKNERKKEEARKRGEDTWMLPSLEERVEQESKKKKKKNKKEKKKKKKHKKDSKNSASESDSADEWIEKDAEPEPVGTVQSNTNEDEAAVPLKRDDWLMAGESFVPTFSRDDLRAKIRADKEEKQRELQHNSTTKALEQPGSYHLELNPFWKDGGTGLPEVEKEWTAGSSGIGDGGVGWLRKALSRVEEQAREDGRSLEELAAEKWGSLKTIKKMIADAEAAEQKSRNVPQNRRRSRSRERGPSSRVRRSRSRDGKPRSRSRSGDRRSRSRERVKVGSPDRNRRSRSRERQRKRRHSSGSSDSDSVRRRRRSRSRSRSPKRRSRSPDQKMDRNKPRSRFLKPGEMDSNSSRSMDNKSRFRKPDDDADRSKSRFRKPDDQSEARFRKPNSGDESTNRRQSETDSSRRTGWKKAEAGSSRSRCPPRVASSSQSPPQVASSSHSPPQVASSSQSPHQAASSSSSSASSEEETEEIEAPKVLTEAEMNALGAKLVKAELMGDDDRAAELKVELDAARQAAANAPSLVTTSARPPRRSKEPETVVLTKTSKTGVSMPLGAAQHEDLWGGRKAKKKKVATHTKAGERERYFADDDKFTLKQMFQREKLGTSEDSNKMFARLAGRGVEKTDDEYQIDDAYLKRATGEQSEAQLEQQDRAEAISQHKKMAQALEKCHYCLDKCAKHLIIAIGVKSYVSLPASASLTDGHCQIIPIEHSPCATKLDEDVWVEMQVFRQTLTKMFAERDEDCVFMETALGVHRHPHMIIECIPVPRETGDMAPIYFKKAIQENGEEWAQNRKLVDISRKDIRHSVPKGFPYFSVDFGLQGGFAHVIEDEQTFSRFFGKEIIGGMLDIEPRRWRKGQRQSFEDQRKKVLEFAGWWKPYDWTVTIKKKN